MVVNVVEVNDPRIGDTFLITTDFKSPFPLLTSGPITHSIPAAVVNKHAADNKLTLKAAIATYVAKLEADIVTDLSNQKSIPAPVTRKDLF